MGPSDSPSMLCARSAPSRDGATCVGVWGGRSPHGSRHQSTEDAGGSVGLKVDAGCICVEPATAWILTKSASWALKFRLGLRQGMSGGPAGQLYRLTRMRCGKDGDELL